jgi:hypothetical protein
MNKRPTPETDAAFGCFGPVEDFTPNQRAVFAFAQKLERQRDALHAELTQLDHLLTQAEIRRVWRIMNPQP